MIELLDFLKLFGGCVYLVLGGDLLVRGALALARKTSVSPVLIGLTVVALGTSAPELMVSVYAALDGFPGIAIGNVVGSNIANVLIVVGLPAMIHPIISHDPAIRRETVFMILVSALFVGLCFGGSFGLVQGLLLVSILLVGTLLTLSGRGDGHEADEEDTEAQLRRVLGLPSGLPTIGLFILLGCIFLPLGADLTVEGAVGFAARFGVPDAVIGSTLVAFGTSLPELSTTVIAAFHKSSDIALGNVLGSNVLNILAIMGITALVADVPVPPVFLKFDLWVMSGAAMFVAVHIFLGRAIGRGSGAVLLAAYFGYFAAVL